MAMRFFLENDGNVWCLDEDSDALFVTETMRPMTEDEINLHLNPPPTQEMLALIEEQWRELQMPIAKNNVTAIEFGEGGIPGTAAQWKAYWLALRKWAADNPDFPDSSKRPVAPT